MNYPVKLYIYDVSHGLAQQISVMLLGRYLEGIWHTAINVYGNEYFFGGDGIGYCPPGGTILGPPTEVVDLGATEISQEIFHEYLESLSETSFLPHTYHILDHNCNTFSGEVALFLTSRTIPSKVSNLSADILNTPFGQMIRPFIEVMQGPVQAAAHHFGPVTSTASNVGNRSNSSQQSKRAPSPKTAKSASPKQAAKSNKNPPKSNEKDDGLDLD